MPTIQTFPGVYTTITDNSFVSDITSRFTVGLAGVATKGAFDTVVQVRSLQAAKAAFGESLSGHYLLNAVAQVADFTDGMYIVRVGRQYEAIATGSSGGGSGSSAFQLYTGSANLFDVNDYIRVSQGGKKTTVNAKVESYLPSGATKANATGLQLVSTGSEAVSLSDTYTSAAIDKSAVANAASNAEAFLYAYQYTPTIHTLGVFTGTKGKYTGTMASGTTLSSAITTITRSGTTATATSTGHNLQIGNQITISGANESNFNGTVTVVTVPNANQFTYTVTNSGSTAATGSPVFVTLAVGDLVKITQTDKNSTEEIRVSEIRADGTIKFEPSDNAQVGYKRVALQDNYTNARFQKVLLDSSGNATKHEILQLMAATAGTWANSNGTTTGLIVRVVPGSAANTKKLEVYENSALVETIDNLSLDSTSTNYWPTKINSSSSFVAVPTTSAGAVTGTISLPGGVPGGGAFAHPLNTREPWDTATYETLNRAAFGSTALSWGLGFNGETPTVADVVGSRDPNTDAATGIQLFEDQETFQLNVIAAPGITDLAVHQELARIARSTNAIAYADVPDSTDATEPVTSIAAAIDWHNGVGAFSDRARIDNPNLAVFANWFQIVDPFTQQQIYVPPTIGALQATARTHDREKPWYAGAGETRGLVEGALRVRFDKISQDVKNASYGAGNSVNLIVLRRGRIMVFGDRTMQVAQSKLSGIHAVILTNYIVNGMAERARKFVFDPNDDELLDQIRLVMSKFLDGVQDERGIEEYNLVVDSSNNNATTRNLNQVIVDVSFIPTGVAETIYINATVRESGAELNSVS